MHAVEKLGYSIDAAAARAASAGHQDWAPDGYYRGRSPRVTRREGARLAFARSDRRLATTSLLLVVVERPRVTNAKSFQGREAMVRTLTTRSGAGRWNMR